LDGFKSHCCPLKSSSDRVKSYLNQGQCSLNKLRVPADGGSDSADD
jgi:hypothetical protein